MAGKSVPQGGEAAEFDRKPRMPHRIGASGSTREAGRRGVRRPQAIEKISDSDSVESLAPSYTGMGYICLANRALSVVFFVSRPSYMWY